MSTATQRTTKPMDAKNKPPKPPKRLAGGQVIAPGHTWSLHHFTIPDEDLDEALTSPYYLSNYVDRVNRHDEIIFKTRSSGWRVHAEIIGINQHLATIELEEYSRHQRRVATIGTSDAESMFPIVDNGLDGFSVTDNRGIVIRSNRPTYEKAQYERRLLMENRAVAAA